MKFINLSIDLKYEQRKTTWDTKEEQNSLKLPLAQYNAPRKKTDIYIATHDTVETLQLYNRKFENNDNCCIGTVVSEDAQLLWLMLNVNMMDYVTFGIMS